MSKHMQHEAFEAKVRMMADGFRSMREQGIQLVFKNESMVPMQAAQRLQVIADHFQGIRDAEETRRLAEEALFESIDGHRAFVEEAVSVVKSHFGSDERRLAVFGIGGSRKPKRRARPQREEREVVRSTMVEEVTVGREPAVEVVRTEEVVETTERTDRDRRPKRRRSEVVTRPSAPVTGAAPAPTKVKPKAGQRR